MTYGVIIGERGNPERWRSERRRFRRGPGTPYRKLQTLKHLVLRDRDAVARFLAAPSPISRVQRVRILRQVIRITNAVRGYHTLGEILLVGAHILQLAGRENLVVVEAGTGAGSSTAKLSLFADAAGGHLHVFDTFRGIPDNDEAHHLLDGTPIRFVKGAFRGRLGAVTRRVQTLGSARAVTFHKGLFEDTLPSFHDSVDVGLLDVDLVASTRTCVRELYPNLRPGGALYSQDGHLRATHTLLSDAAFWRNEVGGPAPHIAGLGTNKLLRIDAR